MRAETEAKGQRVHDLIEKEGLSTEEALAREKMGSSTFYSWKVAHGVPIKATWSRAKRDKSPTNMNYKPKPRLETIEVPKVEEQVMVFIGKPSEVIQYLTNLRGH